MPVPFANSGAALAVAAVALMAAAPMDSFDTLFQAAGEPAFLHASVLFTGSGSIHHMLMWRDHERRILHETDGRITTLATRTAGAGYDLVVLDHIRRTSTRISRDNLYRIGAFDDWFDLGHGLRHPRAGYLLAKTAGPVPSTLPATPAACRWFDLRQGGRVTHICWDKRNHVPLLIADAAWLPAWRVTSIDRAAIATTRFVVADDGYVRNDANRDVEGD